MKNRNKDLLEEQFYNKIKILDGMSKLEVMHSKPKNKDILLID